MNRSPARTIALSSTLAAHLVAATTPTAGGNLPDWSRRRIEILAAEKRLVVSRDLYPGHLEADLNGDRKLDLAVFVRHARTRKAGIAILLRDRGGAVVLGAGFDFGNGGDDFSWMDAWSVHPKGTVARGGDSGPAPRLRGDALLVEKSEAASAVIYWDGRSFRWYQQGD